MVHNPLYHRDKEKEAVLLDALLEISGLEEEGVGFKSAIIGVNPLDPTFRRINKLLYGRFPKYADFDVNAPVEVIGELYTKDRYLSGSVRLFGHEAPEEKKLGAKRYKFLYGVSCETEEGETLNYEGILNLLKYVIPQKVDAVSSLAIPAVVSDEFSGGAIRNLSRPENDDYNDRREYFTFDLHKIGSDPVVSAVVLQIAEIFDLVDDQKLQRNDDKLHAELAKYMIELEEYLDTRRVEWISQIRGMVEGMDKSDLDITTYRSTLALERAGFEINSPASERKISKEIKAPQLPKILAELGIHDLQDHLDHFLSLQPKAKNHDEREPEPKHKNKLESPNLIEGAGLKGQPEIPLGSKRKR